MLSVLAAIHAHNLQAKATATGEDLCYTQILKPIPEMPEQAHRPGNGSSILNQA